MPAFFQLTGNPIGIDACDVAVIAPRAVGVNTESNVILAGNTTVTSALTPIAAAAEVDAQSDGDPFLIGPLECIELGEVWVGGAHVQRVAPTSDGLGCFVTFASSSMLLTFPTLPVATALVGLNSCAGCGGGGGGTGIPVVGNYTPAVTPEAGITANVAPLDTFLYAELTATLEDDRNLVMVGGSVNVSAAAGATDAALFTVTLPIPISGEFTDAYSLVATGARWQDQPGTPIGFGVTRVNHNIVQVAGTLAAGVNYYVNLQLLYNRAGV